MASSMRSFYRSTPVMKMGKLVVEMQDDPEVEAMMQMKTMVAWGITNTPSVDPQKQ